MCVCGTIVFFSGFVSKDSDFTATTKMSNREGLFVRFVFPLNKSGLIFRWKEETAEGGQEGQQRSR